MPILSQRNTDKTHAASLLPLHCNLGRLLVQPQPERAELVLQNRQIVQRFQHVEHDEDEVTRPGNSDDLPASAFAVLGAFDNARQIEHLDTRAVVCEGAGDGGEGRKFVRGRLGVGAAVCQLV